MRSKNLIFKILCLSLSLAFLTSCSESEKPFEPSKIENETIVLELLAETENLQVKETGGIDKTKIKVILKDSNGEKISFGKLVEFSFKSIPNSESSEQEPKLTFDSETYTFGETPLVVQTNSEGIAEVELVSGEKIGEIEIEARLIQKGIEVLENKILGITSGPPEQIAVSADTENLSLGFQVAALVTDVYGNTVDDLTQVNFSVSPVNEEKFIRRVPGTSGNPPIQCEIGTQQLPVQNPSVSIGQSAFTYNTSLSGEEFHGLAFTTLSYSSQTANNGVVKIFANVTNPIEVLTDSILVKIPSDNQSLSFSTSQPQIINEAGACWTWIDISAGLPSLSEMLPIKFSSTSGQFQNYVDLDGWVNNCLYEVDPVSGELEPNSCFALNWQQLNPEKSLPNYPEDFSTPLQPIAFTNSNGVATNRLIFSCNDVDDPQQTEPPFPMTSDENITISVSFGETNTLVEMTSITLTKQSYNPGQDPQTPADLKCRVGTCFNGASPWGSAFCYKQIGTEDLKRRMTDWRSKEVFEIPDPSCTSWYTIGCGNTANLTEELEAQNAK